MLFPLALWSARSNLQDPLAAPDPRGAGSHRLQDGAPLERLNEGIELGPGAGELYGIGVLGNVDNAAPEDFGHALHLFAVFAHCPHLDQHELALDMCRLRQVNHLDHFDELVQLLRNLFDHVVGTRRDNGHARQRRIFRRGYRERLDVVPARGEQTRDSGKSARLVFEHDGNDVSHSSLAEARPSASSTPLRRDARGAAGPSSLQPTLIEPDCVSVLQLLGKNHLGQALAALDHRIDVLGLVSDEIEEHQVVLAFERFLQRRLDVTGLLHLDADVAVALGELDEVGQSVHVRLGVAVAVKELLPLAHHAHVLVVQVDDLDRKPVLLAGRELLDAHLDARLAGDASDRRARVRELNAHGRRQAESHGAQAPGIDPAPRLVEFVELCRPHLVLTDIGGDECIALGDLVESLQHDLRLDDLAFLVVFQAVLGFPQADLGPPCAEGLLVRLVAGRLKLSAQLLEHIGHVSDDRDIDLYACGDRGRVDVDVNDLALHLREVGRVAYNSVIEARAHGKQHVAVLHRHVGFVGAVHPEHAQELRVGCGIAPQAHERIGARETEQFDELGELLRRIGKDHPAPGVDHRALRLGDQLHGLPDLTRMPLHHRVVGTHRHRFRVLEWAFGRRDVLGNVDEHRAGPPGPGEIERFLDRDREILDVFHEEVVLYTGPRDAHRVALLECVQANGVRGHLPRDDHHRDRVHVGGGDPGHRVGDTGTRGHQRHTDLIARARVAVGSMRRALLAAHQDMLDLVLLEQLVVNEEHRPAGIAEDVLDTLRLEALHDNLCARQFHARVRPHTDFDESFRA